jgi:hypothetical protein
MRKPGARCGRSWAMWPLALFSVWVTASGCDRTERLRTELDVARSEWMHRLASVRAQQVEQAARFQQLPAAQGDIPAQAQRRRLEAQIAGSRQTGFDTQTHIDDTVREVEAAITRGETEGAEALQAARVHMAELLQTQEQELGASRGTLAAFGEVR